MLDKIFSAGKADSSIHVGESYALWTQLQAWYDVQEVTEALLNYVKDGDFKLVLEQGIKLTKDNIAKLEDAMENYRVTFPQPPRKALREPAEPMTLTDENIFRLIFDISQTALSVHVKSISICLNDSLRKLFTDFLSAELEAYDILVKFGKTKGWVHYPPSYKLAD
jgi:hypothetical protein